MIEDLWYKNSVIYSLDLETFLDANGDGVGDFEGLVRRLDYLDALGIDAVWLAPFQPTPNRDNGYDISDYYGVDPRHGSSGNFVEFVHQARKRGIKVLMDLVVNHTSDEHPWFRAARSDEDSPYRDWYVWSKKRPEDWKEGIVFPGVQQQTWTYDRKAKAYYFHRFYEFQPDLNMDHPPVRAEIRRIMGYWLELGVEGFRVDAVPFLLEELRREQPDILIHDSIALWGSICSRLLNVPSIASITHFIFEGVEMQRSPQEIVRILSHSLPVLPGKGPLGGHVMSHDQVEAVLMLHHHRLRMREVPVRMHALNILDDVLGDLTSGRTGELETALHMVAEQYPHRRVVNPTSRLPAWLLAARTR